MTVMCQYQLEKCAKLTNSLFTEFVTGGKVINSDKNREVVDLDPWTQKAFCLSNSMPTKISTISLCKKNANKYAKSFEQKQWNAPKGLKQVAGVQCSALLHP